MNAYRATLAALASMMESPATVALDADLDRIRRTAAMKPKHRRYCDVRLTVYFRTAEGVRERSGVYTRSEAALRLKWARKLEDFKCFKTEAVL